MAKKSVGVLHGVVSGDASSYINELKRADEATRARASSISGQMNKLSGDLAREFSAAKIGKNLLSALGIGSGAAVVMTGVDHFVGMWKEAAEYAKEVEDRAKDISKAMGELRQVRFDSRLAGAEPLEKMIQLNREIAATAAKRDAQEEIRARAMRGIQWAGSLKGVGLEVRSFEGEDFGNGVDKPAMPVRQFADEMLRRADEAQLKATEFSKELEKLGAQAGSTAAQLADAEKKLAEERAKGDAQQLELTVKQAIRESPDRSSLKEITPEDEARASEESNRFREELREAGEKNLERMRAATDIRVDDMTRRGLGTGANYQDVGRQTNQILSEIATMIRNRLGNFMPLYSE